MHRMVDLLDTRIRTTPCASMVAAVVALLPPAAVIHHTYTRGRTWLYKVNDRRVRLVGTCGILCIVTMERRR